jgi:hypothetical protein
LGEEERDKLQELLEQEKKEKQAAVDRCSKLEKQIEDLLARRVQLLFSPPFA